MEFNPNIFKAYDIRGKYPYELNEGAAFKIGQAFSVYGKAKQIIVGQDARLSSPALAEALAKGINSQDVEVIDIGLCSTPCFYFSSGISKIPAIMVTASHASKEFNGFKMVFGGNLPLLREQITELKNLAAKDEFVELNRDQKIIKNDNFAQEYINAVKGFITEKFKPMKIIMDAGNGTAGLYAKIIFEKTGIEVVPMFFEPDGNFPNHEANPKIPANRRKLIEKIIEQKADLGMMFDGDADRVYFFDRNGSVIDPNLVSALISRYLVVNSSRKKILTEVRTSKIVDEWVMSAGGEVAKSVCWTIPIKLKMWQDDNFIFGSETSGHYVFSDLYKTDDGILAVVNFLNAISKEEKTIDEIVDDFKHKYFIIEETNFSVKNRDEADKILRTLEDKYKKEGSKILKIDGLTAIFGDWWFNLRVSETEPFIRLNLEANSNELMEQKRAEIIDLIQGR